MLNPYAGEQRFMREMGHSIRNGLALFGGVALVTLLLLGPASIEALIYTAATKPPPVYVLPVDPNEPVF